MREKTYTRRVTPRECRHSRVQVRRSVQVRHSVSFFDCTKKLQVTGCSCVILFVPCFVCGNNGGDDASPAKPSRTVE